MMTRFAALLALLLASMGFAEPASDAFAHPATAAELRESLLAPVTRDLARATVLTGSFTQRRVLQEIPRPLISRGDFLLARELGVQWHTREPFDSELVLTRSGMTMRAESAETVELSAQDQPAVRAAAEIVFALFALDLETLEQRFLLFAAGTPADWQVGLRPRDAVTASVFRQAVISGSGQVERVVLEDAAGDRTEVHLSDVAARSAPLSASERANFD
jgi:hypothetical protein